uniref:SLC26A/SulP transporter domain-containing protein n=1 Tax=Anguilla anguilla TaxID=7936 RepID=A0A0E9Q8F0_ANGAN
MKHLPPDIAILAASVTIAITYLHDQAKLAGYRVISVFYTSSIQLIMYLTSLIQLVNVS